MSAYFWVATIIMTVVATVTLLQPLLRTGNRKMILGITLSVPLVAASLYLLLGSPSVASGRSPVYDTGLVPGSVAPGRPTEKVASVSSMVDGLAARLEANPGDGDGWLLLARSYHHLGRSEDAAAAYARAAALGRLDTGFERQLSPAERGAQIVGTLRLSEHAAAIVKPTDTVFIFARAENSSGAPAAVLRRPATEFPMTFVLDDTNAMAAGAKLSDLEKVTVTARVSRAGVATEALQGLEATAGSVRIDDPEHLLLVIE